jgi:hypothetical protein
MKRITDAQWDALCWLCESGGDCVIAKHGRLLAAGREWPRGSLPSIVYLVAAGFVSGGSGRLFVTQRGLDEFNSRKHTRQHKDKSRPI